MSDYPTYQQYFNAEQAEPVLTVLRENNIPHEFVKNRGVVDAVIAGQPSSSDLYNLKVPSSHFEAVNKLLEQLIVVTLDDLDQDHYLLSFTEDELTELVRKPDEWSIQDVAIAKALLRRKGIDYSQNDWDDIKRERLEILSRSEKIGTGILLLGYLSILFGGGIAIIMGLALWRMKKTLPDGKRVLMYDFSTRRHGKAIFIMGLIVFLLAVFGDFGGYSVLFWMLPSGAL